MQLSEQARTALHAQLEAANALPLILTLTLTLPLPLTRRARLGLAAASLAPLASTP